MKHILSLLFIVAVLTSSLYAQESVPLKTSLFRTPVFLQIPSETSIGAVWGCNGPAAGFVEYSTKEDLSDAKRVYACVPPLRSIQDKVLSVRIRGLEPNTKYYYRAATMPVNYPNAYNVKVGEPEYSSVRSFTTMGDKARSSFAVINDTHSEIDTVKAIDKKLKELQPAVVVWNGDTVHQLRCEDEAIDNLLFPGGCALAENYAFLFVPGNHDFRGSWVRNLDTVLISRDPEEKVSKYWSLGRNFALRQGDFALIGMDTGEDKPDAHSAFKGLAEFEPYRELQTQWLKEVFERQEIKSAPFIVVFCHIPLFNSNPNASRGDSLNGAAAWHKPCADMWSPLFKQYSVQAVITAHNHRFRYDAPTEDRPWAHIVGGGRTLNPKHDTATVINGTVEDGKMILRVYKMDNGKLFQEYKFDPRKNQ
ncbi:MAG: metallophosphoesterase [Thermoguttaceae bacterium]|nr:metallophosphoesterase [Thermoguttaceae bacterium]